MLHFFAEASRSILIFLLFSFFTIAYASPVNLLSERNRDLYASIDFKAAERPAFDLFNRALTGYYQLKLEGRLSDRNVISIIDFRKSANQKRLWVIDLDQRQLLFHSLVAHGKNSGDVFAERFSNIPHSHQSSLGFYITGNTYRGRHGLSLKLSGVEKNINDNAESRAIVMHGADYVSEKFIAKAGRLGRSQGCPAIPYAIHEAVIKKLQGGTCLFIYFPEASYDQHTKLNDVSKAMQFLEANDRALISRASVFEDSKH